MKVKNLQVERWIADTRFINRMTGEEFISKNKTHEKWTWLVVTDDGRAFSCHTDNYGSGIWENNKQTIGTCQFSLFGYSVSGARKKLKRQYNYDWGDGSL